MAREVRQTSFAGGETTPALQARTDLAKYFTSLKTCRNFLVTQHGVLMNRPGTRVVSETKGSGKVRLIPFVFNNDQTFVLEFGAGYIRFHHDGSTVTGPATTSLDGVTSTFSAEQPMEVATPYVDTDLDKYKFVQMGDVVTIVHPLYAPRELKRHSNTNWSLDVISVIHPPGPTGLTFQYDPPSKVRGSDPTNNVAPYAPNADLAPYNYQGGYTCVEETYALPSFVYLTLWRSLQDGNVDHHPHDAANEGIWWAKEQVKIAHNQAELDAFRIELFQPTLNHLDTPGRPARDWRWVVTAVSDDGIETLPSDPLNPNVDTDNLTNSDKICLATDRSVKIKWDSVAGAKYYNVYRGRNGLYGYVGESIDPTFTDDAQAPDYTITPPKDAQPFSTAGDYPATIAYYQQRRWYGGTINNPQTIWGSKVGDYNNFGVAQIPKADDSVEFTLASRQLEIITNLLGLRTLLLLTTSGEWAVSGGQGGPITPSNVEMQPHGYRGSTRLDPIAVGNVALFVQAMGNVVRELIYDYSSDSYTGNDLTILATHLFQGHRIVDWAFAPMPYSILWAVRDDGVLLGCTYLREHEVVAWHRHDTGSGDKYEAVCVVPEGSEHAVYVVSNRGGRRWIERFVSRVVPRLVDGTIDCAHGVFLDAALTYEGAPKTEFAGLDHLEGREVMALADGNVTGPHTVSGGKIDLSEEFPDGASVVHVGLGYVSEAETLDLANQQADMRTASKNVFRANVELIDSRGLEASVVDGSAREWRQRSVADSWDSVKPYSGLIQISLPSAYSKDARLRLRQAQPLPCTIIGIGREADVA